MNHTTISLIFTLLRSVICGNQLTQNEKLLFTEENIAELFALSKHHDIAHLVAFALQKNDILENQRKQFDRYILTAIYRYEQINYTLGKVCEALETAKIPFIPLKGSVIRKYYPEPWTRTSCDIDILVNEEDAERAASYLVDKLEYTRQGKSAHDISLYSPNQSHVELHYDLLEDDYANCASEVLRTVWETAYLCDDYQYKYAMPDEMLYFYHVAHMAKHFIEGGCGIRPFIDLWILDRLEDADHDRRNDLLEKGNLLQFATVARKLSRVWFEYESQDDVSAQMEHYILLGGVYGTTENRVKVQQQKKGGKFKFLCSRIFMPYEELKFKYPILQEHKWLTLIMEIRRWFNLLKPSAMKRSLHEAKLTRNVSTDQSQSTEAFLSNIGLK